MEVEDFDDIKVVSVTGKSFRDKPNNRPKEKYKCHSLSFRFRTILIYSGICLLFLIGVIILITRMRVSLEELDRDALNKSIDRFSMLLYDDVGRLQPYTRHAAWQKVTADAVTAAMRNLPNKEEAINLFIQRYLNTSIVYHQDGRAEQVYRCGSLVNFWGFLHPYSFATLWSEFHPGKDGGFCSLSASEPQPFFPPPFLMGRLASGDRISGWHSIFAPADVNQPMAISIEAIMIPDENGVVTKDSEIYGYLIAAKTIQLHLSTFASNVPGCISMMSKGDEEYFDDFDIKMWNEGTPGSFSNEYDRTFGGTPVFTKRSAEDFKRCKTRYCPSSPLFNDTTELMTGYFTLCGLDPALNANTTCMYFRMDRPMSRVDEGTYSVVVLSVLIIVLMVVLFVLFIIFLDLAILRRVVNLSSTIRNQTFEEEEEEGEEGEEEGEEGEGEEEGVGEGTSEKKKKKRNRKRRGKSYGNSGSKSSGTDNEMGELTSGDEIRNLRLALEQNNARLRRRVQDINDTVRVERQKILHHKQAMQLLSLWCDRGEFFPGLRPNASLLRYEPTRSLESLLSNPLAVEYLKSHCDSDCTLENLFFLLDVSWLSELEEAEDNEEDPAKSKQIHQVVAATASTIVSRYIAEDAPQQINISAATFKVLRDMGGSYKRDMFKEAVGEVKLMLNTDILPRFHKTTAYSAMSENLYVDSLGAEEAEELSSESESTAGSVLSDEADAGASNMVGFNFRNLYSTFDDGMDLGSTCTNEQSIVDSPMPELSAPATTTTTEVPTEIRLGTASSPSIKSGTESREKNPDDEDTKLQTADTLESDKASSVASSVNDLK